MTITDSTAYYDALRDAYQQLPEETPVVARWTQAYDKVMLRDNEGEALAPTFEPSATTPEQFTAQYSEALHHMMAVRGTHLVLPKDFSSRWQQVIQNQRG